NARTCGKADYPTRIILGDHRSSFAFACYLSMKDYRKSPSIQSGLTQRFSGTGLKNHSESRALSLSSQFGTGLF
ncbi:MAG: hypothetical protein MSS41_06160, partial [Collinsella sp.]|nr:hypothetical protein [Collinsella sp.]